MGNSQGKKPKKGKNEEIGILDQVFHEMAVRSPDDTISKDTFLKFFELPGVLGDRLFEVFDYKKTGVIDFEEFIAGYSMFARGDATSKMDILFKLFDLDDEGGISKDELKTVLMSIITPPQQIMQTKKKNGDVLLSDQIESNLLPEADQSNYLTKIDENDIIIHSNTNNNVDGNDNPNKLTDPDASFISYSNGNFDETPLNINDVEIRVNLIVKEAFAKCDVDNNGKLNAKEFRAFLKQKPEVITACEELFVQLAWNGPFQINKGHDYNMIEAEEGVQRYDQFTDNIKGYIECQKCYLRFVNSVKNVPKNQDIDDDDDMETKSNNNNNVNSPSVTISDNNDNMASLPKKWEYVVLQWIDNENFVFKYCPKCGQKLTIHSKKSMANILEDTSTLSLQNLKSGTAASDGKIYYEGNLKLDVGKFRNLKTRFVVLSGKFLYIYKLKNKAFPVAVVFIQGYFVDHRRNPKYDNKYMIALQPPIGSTSKVVHLYCDSKSESLKWKQMLETAARTTSITKFYELGKLLGKGSFAEVRIAVNKKTKDKVAVKIIEKKVIDGKQKEYIRIEMSVMKLVFHPNVMRLEHVFETKNQIYMVMPLYNGGDLYEYMKHNARHGLKEDKAKYVIWNVLHALKYLHGVGIVHRDLKPENLLLKERDNPCDVVITDFGLSKFAAPHQAMKAACGTLSYVAPEVLRMEGYGKEVDLWSLGVIMYLILRAKLPFHDQTKNRIIARILRQKVSVVDPHWAKISKPAKDLIVKLLIKSPKERITCENGIKHEWFNDIRTEIIKKVSKLAKKNNKLKVINDAINDELDESKENNDNNNNNNDNPIEPNKFGISVRDIKYYDGNDDDDDDNDNLNPRNTPIHMLRQNSIQEERNYGY